MKLIMLILGIPLSILVLCYMIVDNDFRKEGHIKGHAYGRW